MNSEHKRAFGLDPTTASKGGCPRPIGDTTVGPRPKAGERGDPAWIALQVLLLRSRALVNKALHEMGR